MKNYLVFAIIFCCLITFGSCTAPSGHKSQAWHPVSPKKQTQRR